MSYIDQIEHKKKLDYPVIIPLEIEPKKGWSIKQFFDKQVDKSQIEVNRIINDNMFFNINNM